jgi:hypothetical protein
VALSSVSHRLISGEKGMGGHHGVIYSGKEGEGRGSARSEWNGRTRALPKYKNKKDYIEIKVSLTEPLYPFQR